MGGETKLTYAQRAKLNKLIRDGEAWASCTNPTLAALERRGLADWETVRGKGFERWFPTPAGREALKAETDNGRS